MAKPELLGEVKKLISMGKEKGFLTYDELNSTLPAEVVSSEQFGSIMTMFGEMDIEIVDAPEGERIRKARDSEESNEDAEDAEVEAGAGTSPAILVSSCGCLACRGGDRYAALNAVQGFQVDADVKRGRQIRDRESGAQG